MTAAFYRTDDLCIKGTKVVLFPVVLEEERGASKKKRCCLGAATRANMNRLASSGDDNSSRNRTQEANHRLFPALLSVGGVQEAGRLTAAAVGKRPARRILAQVVAGTRPIEIVLRPPERTDSGHPSDLNRSTTGICDRFCYGDH